MTEHEKLKAICDKIGYDTNIEFYNWFYETSEQKKVNVREIIFTQEFMDKFRYELKVKHWKDMVEYYMNELYQNLNNSVEYLYNLLELWQKKY